MSLLNYHNAVMAAAAAQQVIYDKKTILRSIHSHSVLSDVLYLFMILPRRKGRWCKTKIHILNVPSGRSDL